MKFHLTRNQLSDVLFEDASPPDIAPADGSTLALSTSTNNAVHEHLSHCLICAGELASLRHTFSSFRDTSIAFASREQLRARLHPVAPADAAQRSFLLQPRYWAAGAAAALLLAVLPLGLQHRQPAPQAAPAVATPAPATPAQPVQSIESDEALLNDINQQLSASVPTAMQPLADPTASAPNSTSLTQRSN